MRSAIALLLLAADWPCTAAQSQSTVPATPPPIAIQVTGARLVRTPPPGIMMPRFPVDTEN